MIKLVLALVLLAHGIGHSMGPLAVFKIATINPAWQGDSWLLAGLGATASQVIGLLLWTAALVGFTLLAAVTIGWLPPGWWAPLAIVSAIASLAGVVLFPAAFPLLSTIGAAVIDVAVLVAVVWLNWDPGRLAV